MTTPETPADSQGVRQKPLTPEGHIRLAESYLARAHALAGDLEKNGYGAVLALATLALAHVQLENLRSPADEMRQHLRDWYREP